MDLIKYNREFVLPAVGFDNIGFTCYYNALLQALLSCTSFVEELTKPTKEPFLCCLKNTIDNLFVLSRDPNNTKLRLDIQHSAPVSWRYMIKKLATKSPEFARLAVGQQCAAEGFSLLMQSIEEYANIQNLFIHRRLNRFHCNDCRTTFSTVEEINNIFEVEPLLDSNIDGKPRGLNEFLLNQKNAVDANCVCSNCGIKNEKVKKSRLVMVPEILFVMSKKYKYEAGAGEKLNVYTDFPETLHFDGKNGTLEYEACALIQHAGNLSGGHYWAICKRKGGWFNINDVGVSPASFCPDINTYIVLYHII